MSSIRAITKPTFPGGSVELVASDGDTYTVEVPPPGGGSRLYDASVAAQLAEAGALWLPPAGSFEEAVLDMEPIFYYPADPRLGNYDYSGYGATITPTNGAALVNGHQAGMHPGAVSLDGVNDYVATNFGTRRQRLTNPRSASVANTSSYNATSVTRVTDEYLPGTNASVKVVTPGVTPIPPGAEGTNGSYTNNAILPSTAIRGGIWIKAPLGATLQLLVSQFSSAPAYVGAIMTDFVGTGEWQWVTVSGTSTASAAWGSLAVRTRSTAQAITWWEGPGLIEHASGSGQYFDGDGQVINGTYVPNDELVGWLGTAHASQSDEGCFANGTVRTFVAAVKRDTARQGALIGSNGNVGGSGNYLIRTETDGKIRAWHNTNTGGTGGVAGDLPVDTLPHLVVVTDNEPGDSFSYHADGVFKRTEAEVNQIPDRKELVIGAHGGWAGGGSFYFDGLIGPVAVFPRALTAAEHALLYERVRYRFW